LSWLARYPDLAKRHQTVARRILQHRSRLILACRFLPGSRIAIAAACANVGVCGVRFSTLNLMSGFAWASSIMAIVAYFGPQWVTSFGGNGWWSLVVPALLMYLFLRWIGREAQTLASKTQ